PPRGPRAPRGAALRAGPRPRSRAPSSRAVFVRGEAVQPRGKRRRIPVLVGEDRRVDRPLDPDRGIVPEEAQLAAGVVEVAALVLDLGPLAQHAEAVREALRHEDLAEVLAREEHRDPAAEGRRAAPDVD